MDPSKAEQALPGTLSSTIGEPPAGRPSPGISPLARVGVVWLALVLVWVAMGLLREHALAPNLPFDLWRLVESLLGGALAVAMVVAACRRLDRRSLASLGLGRSRAHLDAFFTGAGLWLSLALLGTTLASAAGWLTVSLAPPTWSLLGWLLLQGLLVFSYEALPEELGFRGYIYTNLAERGSRWVAVVGQAVLFTLWAFALVWLLGLLGVGSDWSIDLDRMILFFTFGITLALVRLWTDSLWAAIGFHWAFQTVMQLLYLDRLTVVRVPAEELMTAGVVTWLFGIIGGGAIALIGLMRK